MTKHSGSLFSEKRESGLTHHCDKGRVLLAGRMKGASFGFSRMGEPMYRSEAALVLFAILPVVMAIVFRSAVMPRCGDNILLALRSPARRPLNSSRAVNMFRPESRRPNLNLVVIGRSPSNVMQCEPHPAVGRRLPEN